MKKILPLLFWMVALPVIVFLIFCISKIDEPKVGHVTVYPGTGRIVMIGDRNASEIRVYEYREVK